MGRLKSYSAKTHQGPLLQVNEDDYDVDLRNQLFFLMDGFGGAGVGDKAVGMVKSQLKNFYTKIALDPESTLPFFFSPRYLIEGNALINSLKSAHQTLKNENAEKDMSSRGGVSLVAVAASESLLTLVSVGNCASYLYRQGHLELLTYPDCLKPLSDDYQRSFYLHPLSALGLFDEIEPQVRELRLQNDDQVILLSDGVYGRLKEEEIKFVLEKKTEKGHLIDELFAMANSRGNLDNQTAVILRF